MRFKNLKYKNRNLTENKSIERVLIETGYAWLLDCEIEEANLEISKGRLKWLDGIFYTGIWVEGEWHKGEWFYGQWLNGRWLEGIWYNGIWTDGIWEDGEFHGGEVIRGIFKNTRR
jgi:hypothetical protein